MIDEIIAFVVGGSDSTTNYLTAIILHVFAKSSVAERLMKEINEVIQHDEDITVDNMKKMTYLNCVLT